MNVRTVACDSNASSLSRTKRSRPARSVEARCVASSIPRESSSRARVSTPPTIERPGRPPWAEAGEESEGGERRMGRERIEELERQIAELKRRWPAHSVPPTMLQQLDELEEELEREVNGAVEEKHSVKADGRGGLWEMPTREMRRGYLSRRACVSPKGSQARSSL
jgi:hypothetical protein